MIRTVIQIDQEACTGCGLCVSACHEGAIGLVSGKAQLLRDYYCDGLGDCLPSCPVDAISIVRREAEDYNARAAQSARIAHENAHNAMPSPGACQSSLPELLRSRDSEANPSANHIFSAAEHASSQVKSRFQKAFSHDPAGYTSASELVQWPVQIRLVPSQAPFFHGAHLLVAADCTAFTYANFHHEFMHNKITLIGCPKLDEADYTEKLAEILSKNDVRSVSVVRMEVPCCVGIENAVREAVQMSRKSLPLSVAIFSTRGDVIASI